MTFKHAAPIEAVLPLLSGTVVLAASDNQISVLDLVAARPVEVLKSHQKTVTALALATNGTRVVSGGLDGHVKIFDTTNWTVVAGSKYPSPILSLEVITSGTQNEDRHMAVGMQSGLLSLRTRLSGELKVQKREKDKEMKALMEGNIEEYDRKNKKKQLTSGMSKRLRGIEYQGHGADIIIEGNERRKNKKLPQWDQALRKVQYARALDLALAEEPQNPITVLTILTALHQRSALQAALRGRDETTLQPVMKWLIKHLSDPRHIVLTSHVSKLLLDMYAGNVGQSQQIDRLVIRLHERVRALVDRSQDTQSTMGMLEMIMLGT